jgi:intracellular septation protein
MRNTAMTQNDADLGTAADKANQIWGDLVPVMGFVLVYNLLRFVDFGLPLINSETALYWATGVLIALTLGVVGQKLITRQKIPPFLIVSSLIVGGFGTLGIVLQDKSFIYIKPTIQNLFLASLIFGGFLFGRNIWRAMFKQVFDLPNHAWNTLATRWGLLFVAMAAWNEFLWRYYAPGFEQPLVFAGLTIAPAGSYEFLGLTFGNRDAEDVWANWKLGNMVIVFLFGLANVPYTLKHLGKGERDIETASR